MKRASDMEEASLPSQHSISAIPATSFSQTWSPSAANAFDISTLPVTKAHKAWERRPQEPRSNVAKYKKVWKTYGLRSTDERDCEASAVEKETDRARAVKRMCVNGSTAPVLPVIASKARKNYAGTKFDRRKSGITRKTRVLRDISSAGSAQDESVMAEQSTGTITERSSTGQPAEDAGDASPKRVLSVGRKRRSLGRHSLGANRGIRRSFGGNIFGSIAEEPAQETVDALGLSPRKKPRRNYPVEDGTVVEVTAGDEDVTQPSSDEAAGTENRAVDQEPDIVPELAAQNTGAAQAQRDSEDIETQTCAEKVEASVQEASQEEEELSVESSEGVGEEEVKDTAEDSVRETIVEEEEPPMESHDVIGEDATDEKVAVNDADGADAEVAEEDMTTNWADETTTHLELDTALLKDFLSRTAAAKATRLETGRRLSLPRRVSLQNRRDSDVVRMALASPRKPLDDKDPNSPAASPAKLMDLPGVKGLAAELDAITGGPLGSRFAGGGGDDDDDTTITGIGSRRSARQRSRLPGQPSEQKAPNKISVKRTDGSDPVVMKKTEAQELSVLTRSNTRRNKGSSLARLARLKKLKLDGMADHWTEGKIKEMAAMNVREDAVRGMSHSPEDQGQEPAWKVPAAGDKGVRWKDKDELLSFFGGAPAPDGASDTSAEDVTFKIPPPSSLNSLSASALSAQVDIDSPRKRGDPARIRRLRGLGAANGTPGKGLLATASLLPDEVAEEKEKSKLPPPRERKSRIAAPTPKKLKLTMKGDEAAPSMLKAPEVSVPKSLSMSASTSLTGVESKEVTEARERRLASPRKIPQFSSGLAAPSGGSTRRKRM